MNRVQRTALLAFFLLLLMAMLGWWLGGQKSTPADAEPDLPMLDVHRLPVVNLLPPEKRKPTIDVESFRQPPVDDPYDPRGGRQAGERVALTPPEPEPTPPPDQTVRVRQGDTLSGIAARELGSAKRWRELMELNGLRDERDLKLGQLLILPTSGSAPTGRGENSASVAAAGTTRTHLVQPGEALSKISAKYYGTSRETGRILEANGLKDANRIQAGQTLTIPPLD